MISEAEFSKLYAETVPRITKDMLDSVLQVGNDGRALMKVLEGVVCEVLRTVVPPTEDALRDTLRTLANNILSRMLVTTISTMKPEGSA